MKWLGKWNQVDKSDLNEVVKPMSGKKTYSEWFVCALFAVYELAQTVLLQKRVICPLHSSWRNRKIWLTLAFFWALILLVPQYSRAERAKATWIWSSEWIRNSAQDILLFCQTNGVDIIYLQVSNNVGQEAYHLFNRKAREVGINVYALHGDPTWARVGQGHKGEVFIQWVIDYNRQAAQNERFVGVHLDVEPYSLSDWEQNKTDIIRSWTGNMRTWLLKGRQADLFMTADVPFWLYRLNMSNEEKSVSRWMLEQFDSLTVMAYRNQSDLIYNVAQALLMQADEVGKRLFLGVTLVQSSEGENVSFYGKSLEYFQDQLRAVENQGASHSSFAGVAVHHLRLWYDVKGGRR